MRHVRAKFRCLGITEKWDGSFVAELSPVMQKGENSEENKQFWSASPSGECHLTYHAVHDLKVGAYYYIDMVQDDEGKWSLDEVSDRGEGSGEVFFYYYRNYDYQKPKPHGLITGNFKIGIDGQHTNALSAFGKAGTKWKVDFTFAEASDD
jgi:hypothetical protein